MVTSVTFESMTNIMLCNFCYTSVFWTYSSYCTYSQNYMTSILNKKWFFRF